LGSDARRICDQETRKELSATENQVLAKAKEAGLPLTLRPFQSLPSSKSLVHKLAKDKFLVQLATTILWMRKISHFPRAPSGLTLLKKVSHDD